jgi:excisionase family DNA binding protein
MQIYESVDKTMKLVVICSKWKQPLKIPTEKEGIRMNEELLDVKQVRQMLKVSERTVFNLIARGELKGFKAGRSWRFRMADVQDYENRQRRKAQEQTEQPKRSKKQAA